MAEPTLVQPQAFTAEGAPIAPEHVAAAVASGNAFFQKGAKVIARGANGRLVTVDPEDAAHPGLSVVSPAELAELNEKRQYGKGLGNTAAAAAAGAARGLTLGASDAAARALSPDTADSLAALQRQQPVASTLGEIGGVIVPSLFTGGAAGEVEGASALARGASTAARVASAPVRAVGALGGAATRGAEAVLGGIGGEGLAARAVRSAVGHAVGGAAEGAVFGAGATLSESALKGEPITSEALVASLGRNALFGGAIGAGVGALSKLGPAALKSVLPSSEKLDDVAVKFARKQLGRDFENVGKGQPREAAEAWKNASAKQLLERKLVGGENSGKTIFEASKNPQDIADNLGQMRRDVGAELGEVRERAAVAMDANPALAPNVDELIVQVEARARELRKTKVAGNYALARTMEREIAPLKEAIAERAAPGFSPAAEAAEGGAVGLDDAVSRVPGSVVANDVAPSMGYRELLKWHQNLEQSLNPAGVAKSMRGLAIKNFGAKQEVADLANTFLRDHTARALTAAGEDGSIVQRLHQEYAGTMAMQQAAEKEAKRIASNRHVSLTDHMLGIGSALMAMASGNVGALATMGLGGAAAIGNKIAREQGNAIMATIAQKLARHDSLLESAAKALALPEGLGRRATGVAAAATESRRAPSSDYVPLGAVALRKDFDEARERVRLLGTPDHMQAQLAHATGPIAEAYPEAAAGMSQRLLAVHDYLAQSVPEGEAPPVMTPLARAAGVEPRAMQKWLSKVNAALDPMEVIRDVARGKLDYDAVQTVKDVYPATFDQLRNLTIQYTSANKEQLPFSRVAHLSDVFGFNGDSSFTPERLPGIQAAIQQINAPPNASAPGTPGQTKRARPSSAQSNKLGKPYNLPGQATPGEH